VTVPLDKMRLEIYVGVDSPVLSFRIVYFKSATGTRSISNKFAYTCVAENGKVQTILWWTRALS
jgi:hypothetical protein